MKFSQRIGATPTHKLAQRESLDEELKNSLWSVVSECCFSAYRSPSLSPSDGTQYVRKSNMGPLVDALWLYHFKWPIDTIPQFWSEFQGQMRSHFFRCKWHEIYDFIEFIARNQSEEMRKNFVQSVNHFLEIENSAYRFVGDSIAEITSDVEIAAVQSGIESSESNGFAAARTHLSQALAHLSHRTRPDYRNSAKESISAVESAVQVILGRSDGTLGQLLSQLEREDRLHKALKQSFSSLYGYTSNADGIRHALTDAEKVTHKDAKLMLVTCSAFIGYLIEGAAEK